MPSIRTGEDLPVFAPIVRRIIGLPSPLEHEEGANTAMPIRCDQSRCDCLEAARVRSGSATPGCVGSIPKIPPIVATESLAGRTAADRSPPPRRRRAPGATRLELNSGGGEA